MFFRLCALNAVEQSICPERGAFMEHDVLHVTHPGVLYAIGIPGKGLNIAQQLLRIGTVPKPDICI